MATRSEKLPQRKGFSAYLRAPFVAIGKAIDLADVHAYGGAALVGYGVWYFEPAAAFIIVGAFLIYLGVFRR